ncbi:MAG: PTS transporter subunit EIIC [Acidaminococcaceae bacterium]|nr:PTS transporter subunit EIIC [Acidaminococcaceae bacterium]MBP3811651.1 PTS transporter subunit EIIC [Acidaminococcaceae bacterium]MBQ5343735.1 PTS transporter subunit EIIC [Acidaminococcaceae bacterium]
MKFLQKLGKAIMLPVACLPLCGILMGIGYLLCPASMQGGSVTGLPAVMGMFLVKAGGALINHIALLFAVGIGAGMADDNNGAAGIAALVSWLMLTTLLQPDTVKLVFPAVAEHSSALLAFAKIENPFIGILAGLIGALCYNRFKNTVLPEWLAFFSGKRSAVIVAGIISVIAAALLVFIWPTLFAILIRIGREIAGAGAIGAGLYAFLNRLLIPLGLHHALNNVFWFDTIGLGDLTNFWAGKTSADVSWSLGMYMSGYFPCMMFGVPGAALAMVQCAKQNRKSYATGIVASAALCSFVCGITEPFEFAFMFAAPALYVAYALLYGVFSYVVALTGFRAGFAFSAGATDLLFSASLPASQETWQIVPLSLAAFVIFYAVFRFLITKFDMKTPGRNESDGVTAESADKPVRRSERVEGFDLEGLLQGLGGKDNILQLDNCVTRLRIEVKDDTAVHKEVLVKAGAKGVIRPGKNSLQVVIGPKVQRVADALREACLEKK